MKVQEVIEKATRYCMEFNEVNVTNSMAGQRGGAGGKRWRKPLDGLYKINTDAAVFVEGSIGLGGVVRDAHGEVMVACCGKMAGRFEVDVAEALAIRFVLLISWEAGYIEVMVESDCLKLISHLKKKTVQTSSFGVIVHDNLTLAESFSRMCFSHTCRSGNKVAHTLAQLSRSFSETRIWMMEAPSEIQSFVLTDLELAE